MIYLMIENVSGSVIRSQVLSVLIEIAQQFDLDVDLIAMERKAVWEVSNHLEVLRRELGDHRVRPHIFLHHGRRHPITYVNLSRMLFKLLKLLLKDGRQVVLARNIHSAFAAMPFRLLFSGSRLVLDLRGVFVHELLLRGVVREGGVLHRFLIWMERRSYAGSDHVLCVSDQLAQVVAGFVGNRKEISVVPCCVEPGFFLLDAAKTAQVRQALDLVDKFVVLYAGSITSWNLVESMLDLFAVIRMAQPNAHFLFLTAAVDEARQAFAQRGWPDDNYTIMTVSHREIKNYIPLGDLGMLLREDNLVNRVASPVKFGEYVACGLPVCITPWVGDFSDLVAQRQVGLVINPDDESLNSAVTTHVRDIWDNREQYRRRSLELGRTCFHRKAYYDIYKRLLSKDWEE